MPNPNKVCLCHVSGTAKEKLWASCCPVARNPQCPVIITRFHSQTFKSSTSKQKQIWSGVIGIQVRRELGQVRKLQAYRTVLAFFSSAMFAMSHQPNSSGGIIARFPLISGWCLAMGCSGTKSRLILMIPFIEFAHLCKKNDTPKYRIQTAYSVHDRFNKTMRFIRYQSHSISIPSANTPATQPWNSKQPRKAFPLFFSSLAYCQ